MDEAHAVAPAHVPAVYDYAVRMIDGVAFLRGGDKVPPVDAVPHLCLDADGVGAMAYELLCRGAGGACEGCDEYCYVLSHGHARLYGL